jgi:NAD(P)-dependent dehydrogenase (short-subunit alcohol dehydrogenase family)
MVTGAGRGIGEAIARRFAADGALVGVLDVDTAGAARVATDIGGVALVAATTDAAAIEVALDIFGTPDVLVNNAGIVRFGPLLDLDETAWRAVVDVNLTGTFIITRAVARRLVAKQRPGAIVNITSMNGVAPGPNAGAYGSTKAAVSLLTQQMALEWGPYGIRVNAVAPGLIDAGMSEPIYADPGIRAAREGKVPLGRLGRADDIADVVAFLASDGARYVTGQTLLVDGGVTMSVIAGLPRPASVDGAGPKP